MLVALLTSVVLLNIHNDPGAKYTRVNTPTIHEIIIGAHKMRNNVCCTIR